MGQLRPNIYFPCEKPPCNFPGFPFPWLPRAREHPTQLCHLRSCFSLWRAARLWTLGHRNKQRGMPRNNRNPDQSQPCRKQQRESQVGTGSRSTAGRTVSEMRSEKQTKGIRWNCTEVCGGQKLSLFSMLSEILLVHVNSSTANGRERQI